MALGKSKSVQTFVSLSLIRVIISKTYITPIMCQLCAHTHTHSLYQRFEIDTVFTPISHMRREHI